LLGGLLECVRGRRVRSDGTFADGRHRKLHPQPCEAWFKRARLGDETWESAVLAQLAGVRLDDATIAAVVATMSSDRRPVAIERGRLDRQIRELALEHAAEAIDDATYLERAAALRAQRDALAEGGRAEVSPDRVVAWLRAFGEAVQRADLPAEKTELIHAVYERIVVAGPRLVGARLTPAAYRHGMSLALPQVVMARPTGFNRADAINIRIPIEGANDRIIAAGA
jgi:hypothetical protein